MTIRPVVLDEATVRSLVSRSDALEVTRRTHLALAAGRVVMPEQIGLELEQGDIHVKGAHVVGSPYVAFKVATGFPGNESSGRRANDGFTFVLDARDGSMVAQMHDHGWLTEMRTGAAGALAADLMARPDASSVALIGAGTQARFQLEALLGVRSVDRVTIWNRSAPRAVALADVLRTTHGLTAEVAPHVREAVKSADIVVTATASRSPLLRRAWLRPGTHVTSVGSDFPDKQELGVDVMGDADLVVADDVSACARLGELHHAVEAGVLTVDRVVELSDIVTGAHPGRTSADQVTVVDQCGRGAYDAAMADLVMIRYGEGRE